MNTLSLIFISVLLVSLISLGGVLFLSFQKNLLQKFLFPLVGFATGALFANVFLHLLPEAVEKSANPILPFSLVLGGIVLSLILEKFIHWHHCHSIGCPDHTHPLGTLMIIGDGIHNALDGILIASAYIAGTELGIAMMAAFFFIGGVPSHDILENTPEYITD